MSPQDARPVLASVLDRLLDDEPESEREVPLSANDLMDLLRNALRRDVECFLNSRQRCVPVPEELAELESSIVNYGIPDIMGTTLSSPRRRRQFLRSVEGFLRAYEPRFKSVNITPMTSNDPADRTMHFRIDAVMYADPVPESLMLNSVVEPVSRSFSISV